MGQALYIGGLLCRCNYDNCVYADVDNIDYSWISRLITTEELLWCGLQQEYVVV
jgi:hypothetical protein